MIWAFAVWETELTLLRSNGPTAQATHGVIHAPMLNRFCSAKGRITTSRSTAMPQSASESASHCLWTLPWLTNYF
jgi:hypothetical protein